MIVAVNVVGDSVGTGLGKAKTMAVAQVEDGQIESWQTFDVGWDVLHDQVDEAGHGAHHARIVKFMKDNAVEAVVSGHVGPPMIHTLDLMGLAVIVNAAGDARQAVIDSVALLRDLSDDAS